MEVLNTNFGENVKSASFIPSYDQMREAYATQNYNIKKPSFDQRNGSRNTDTIVIVPEENMTCDIFTSNDVSPSQDIDLKSHYVEPKKHNSKVTINQTESAK